MQPNKTHLPDNLKSRVSRLYRKDETFKNDSGETINFSRLVIECLVKDEVFNLEVKLDKKDWAILALADVVEGQTLATE